MRYCTILCLVLSFFLSAGCANIMPGSSSEPLDPNAPPAQTSFYYDFKDIQVPEEMELQTSKSSISPAESGKAGVMKFKGRVEPISLFDFFYNTMPKDGWNLLTYQKYQRYLLVFSKENRISVITIETDPIYYTTVEIWVSPLVPGTSSSVYSTGAQPIDTYPASGPAGSGERVLSE